MDIYTCKDCGSHDYYQCADGRKRCKPCHKKKMKIYYKTDHYKMLRRRGMRKYRHGITDEQFVILLNNQNYQCAICGDIITHASHLDHDHKTGKIRGILCPQCNHGLGQFKDSIFNLSKAIDYLS